MGAFNILLRCSIILRILLIVLAIHTSKIFICVQFPICAARDDSDFCHADCSHSDTVKIDFFIFLMQLYMCNLSVN